MRLEVLRADPAGNVTLIVLTPVAPGRRAEVAARLMARPRWGAEQVGFAAAPCQGGEGRLEMMGGEFCGNAARGYGLLLAARRGASGPVSVELSGCAAPLAVTADVERGTAACEMPLPVAVGEIELAGVTCTLVDLGGIVHAVAPCPPDIALLDRLETLLAGRADAFGVMFLAPDEGRPPMVPVVRVPAVGSTVWERSCGSGSVAAAIHLARTGPALDGASVLRLSQPGGVIEVSLSRRGGKITAAAIGGPVSLGAAEAVRM